MTMREEMSLSPLFDERAAVLLEAARAGGLSARPADERVVVIGEEPVRRVPLCKTAPASLADASSKEELRGYTVDALRKLAKKEGVELGKACSRDAIIQVLSSASPAPCDRCHGME